MVNLATQEIFRIFTMLMQLSITVKIKVMFTAVEKSNEDYMGFTWFEVFKNGKPTGNSFNALNKEHAIRMYKQFKQIK